MKHSLSYWHLLFVLLLVLAVPVSGYAAPVTVTGYDIQDAAKPGFGGWAHYYTGSITDKGTINVSGYQGTLADYQGGGGTMNDNILGTSESNTQLFATSPNPRITLYFDQAYRIENITLYAFSGSGGNAIPGNITGCDVLAGSESGTFATTIAAGPTNEYIDLTGSSVNSQLVNSIILTNFTTTGSWSGFFSVSEISLNGGTSPVPIPGAVYLLGSGLIGLVGLRKKARK